MHMHCAPGPVPPAPMSTSEPGCGRSATNVRIQRSMAGMAPVSRSKAAASSRPTCKRVITCMSRSSSDLHWCRQ